MFLYFCPFEQNSFSFLCFFTKLFSLHHICHVLIFFEKTSFVSLYQHFFNVIGISYYIKKKTHQNDSNVSFPRWRQQTGRSKVYCRQLDFIFVYPGYTCDTEYISVPSIILPYSVAPYMFAAYCKSNVSSEYVPVVVVVILYAPFTSAAAALICTT